MTITHREAQTLIQTARNRAAGKPIANNTRLYGEEGGDFNIKYHNTFIVTIHTDGTYTLRNGGYNTSTTLMRIRDYTPCGWQQLYSERGEWYVNMKPVKRDPRPERVERTIPKPFTPGDWIEEPVKATEGCKAGQMVTTEHVDELVEIYRHAMQTHDVIQEVVSHGFSDDGKYDRVKVKRTWTDHVFYTEKRHYDEAWNKLPGNTSVHSDVFHNENGERVKRIQCPHCAEFDAIHERWRVWMEGPYNARFDSPERGYRVYREMMDRFHNDKDLWQAGYIEDFRARRAYLKADREWEIRNRVPFYDGIRVDHEGWAPRIRQEGPSPAKLRRYERDKERMQKRIEKYLDAYINELVKGMAMPGTGDCWYCFLQSEDGKSMADANNNHGHLVSHMEDRYYVPSLAVVALRDSGKLTDAGIYVWLDMNPDANQMGGRGNAKHYDTVKRALRRYMSKRLIPEAPTS